MNQLTTVLDEFLGRSLCEDPAASEWQASKEEEDHGEEEYAEPILQ